MTISPTWKFAIQSAFWEAPFNKPLSQSALLPVGSSSTSSVTLVGNRIYKIQDTEIIW